MAEWRKSNSDGMMGRPLHTFPPSSLHGPRIQSGGIPEDEMAGMHELLTGGACGLQAEGAMLANRSRGSS